MMLLAPKITPPGVHPTFKYLYFGVLSGTDLIHILHWSA